MLTCQDVKDGTFILLTVLTRKLKAYLGKEGLETQLNLTPQITLERNTECNEEDTVRRLSIQAHSSLPWTVQQN